MNDQIMKDKRFNNRRRMAWISFWFMLVVGGWMLWQGVTTEDGADRIEKLSFLLGTLFGMCTTIVVSYFTASTVTQVNDLKFGGDGVKVYKEVIDPPEAPQEGK
jgi:sulfite exporter TauE/SafE